MLNKPALATNNICTEDSKIGYRLLNSVEICSHKPVIDITRFKDEHVHVV